MMKKKPNHKKTYIIKKRSIHSYKIYDFYLDKGIYLKISYPIKNIKDYMTNYSAPPSLHTLPIELIYRIMDNLDSEALVYSLHDVCVRINTIMDKYEPYMV